MLEFKVIQELEPNNERLNLIKNSTFATKNGRVKHLFKTNLQFIEPIEYLITYPTTLTLFEYKVNEISSKNFYIKENSINYKIKKYVNVDKTLDNHKQMF